MPQPERERVELSLEERQVLLSYEIAELTEAMKNLAATIRGVTRKFSRED